MDKNIFVYKYKYSIYDRGHCPKEYEVIVYIVFACVYVCMTAKLCSDNIFCVESASKT